MADLLYVETTIPSFYYENRRFPEMVARRNWTRRWWDEFSSSYELVSAPPVLVELDRTPSPKREEMLELMETVHLLKPLPEIDDIVAEYLSHKLMPLEASEDDALGIIGGMKKQRKYDDGLGWLREIRKRIAQECGFDPHKLGEMYRRVYREEMERRSARDLALRERRGT